MLQGVFAFMGLLPIAWVAGILTFAIRARVYLGYWPTPSHPDPKVLPFDLHHAVLWFSFFGLLYSLIIILSLYLLNHFFWRSSLPRWSLRAYLLGWALVLLMVFVPGMSFVGWFLD